MLKTDFYTIQKYQFLPGSLSCEIVFNASHKIFEGHFPEQPVVPGVCMIQIVKELLEQQLNVRFLLRSAGQVKFLQLITPGISPVLHISWKPHEGGYFVNAFFKKDADLFKFTGFFELQ